MEISFATVYVILGIFVSTCDIYIYICLFLLCSYIVNDILYDFCQINKIKKAIFGIFSFYRNRFSYQQCRSQLHLGIASCKRKRMCVLLKGP